jgi:hypothetical protein
MKEKIILQQLSRMPESLKKDLLACFEAPDPVAAFLRQHRIQLNSHLDLIKQQLVEVLRYAEGQEESSPH